MAVKVQMDGDIAVVTPRGSLIGGDETVELERILNELKEKDNKKLVIDLGSTDMMTSRPLGVMVATLTNYTRREGKVHLCNVDKRIKNILVITKLVQVFDIYNTLEGAMGSF